MPPREAAGAAKLRRRASRGRPGAGAQRDLQRLPRRQGDDLPPVRQPRSPEAHADGDAALPFPADPRHDAALGAVMAMDLARYFERIGFRGTPAASLEVLWQLHALHPEAIPFENLSPFLGEPVKLDVASLEEKLVRGARGGWCFEHNLLFSHVLLGIGFHVTRLAARVRWNVAADVTTARSHMLMLVRIAETDYVADVGFGGLTLTAPLRLAPGEEQRTALEPHRISVAKGAYVMEAKVAGEWQAPHPFHPPP